MIDCYGEKWWERYKVDVPEGTKGDVCVERFSVSEEEAKTHEMRCIFAHEHGRAIMPGTYTRLKIGRQLWMSDTPAEVLDHMHLFARVKRRADRGEPPRVLLHGLGLGMALHNCLRLGAEHVTVVEINEDVLSLVGSHWEERYASRVLLRHDDALTWKPVRHAYWDIVWHDIWLDPGEAARKEMTRMHRRFGRRCSWQDSWGRE